MNGDMNGVGDEDMETSETAMLSPKSKENACSSITNNHCDENVLQNSSNEDSNNLDHTEDDNSDGPADSSRPGISTSENIRMAVDSPRVSQNQRENNTNKNTNVPANNESSNSNAFNISSDRHNSVDSINIDNPKDGESDEESDDEESEEDSTDEDGTIGSEEPRAEDTVSINSDSDGGDNDSNMGSQANTKKHNDIIILDNLDRNCDNASGGQSPEVHEIVSDNDDEIMTDEKSNSNSAQDTRRRSSRNRKQRSYEAMENGEDESDIEEVLTDDPLDAQNNKPIVVNDTKALVEMAAQQMKSGSQKKEPTVVIIDTNSIMSGKVPTSLTQSKPNAAPVMSAQSLYQSIAARGTTVTPVSSKQTSTAIQTTQQPIILPSLTDDMYVVEAPSFIVPYVYEKPSVRAFREFVDELGKELEHKRLKEEAERAVKEREEKEKRDKERRERGEESEKEDEDVDKEELEKEIDQKASQQKVEEPVKNKKDKRNRKRGRTDEDDASWDEECSDDSEEEAISEDDTGTTVVIKEKADDANLDSLKTDIVTDITESKPLGVKSDNYFDNPLGKFFTNIGVSLVQEFVQNDLLKQQKRKLHKELKTGCTNTKPTESAIHSLSKNLEFSKENNAPYRFSQKKCKFCTFKTESALVMEHHLETPHMKNNIYNCNFCPFEIKSPHDILYHMEEKHNTRGRLERAPAYHQCANCPFEDNGKGKLARHLIPCAKKFKPEINLAPPAEWEPPAKIPKITRARNNMMNSYQAAFNRSQVGAALPTRQPINISGIMPQGIGNYRARSRSPMGVSPRGAPPHGAPLLRGNVMMRHNTPAPLTSNYPIMPPSISITPLPRAPVPPQPAAQQAKGTFVICEICDGYIKDLEQLRNHMQWIHKVKIHPKMIYNRPPLNCQKCQFRFFTDQGLERHLLGSHGLVTSSMQEAANKGKDAGRCPVCGRVYQWKLLNHVARDHNMTLKPAHLSYKCTVCTATFGMYKQFENHVYSAHSVVAKRVVDKGKTSPAAKPAEAAMKPVKINDEITIIPQPTNPVTASAKGKKD